MIKLKQTMTLKDGTVYHTGTVVEDIKFNPEQTRLVYITINGRVIRLNVTGAYRYLKGFNKPPTVGTLEKWSWNCVSKTPTGYTTEPDGVGPDGSPSWMRILGYI
jgi:hypothetical protein